MSGWCTKNGVDGPIAGRPQAGGTSGVPRGWRQRWAPVARAKAWAGYSEPNTRAPGTKPGTRPGSWLW